MASDYYDEQLYDTEDTYKVYRISELEALLKEFREKHGDLRAVSTYESLIGPIIAYRSKPGLVANFHPMHFPSDEPSPGADEEFLIIDAETGGYYRQQFEHPDDKVKS